MLVEYERRLKKVEDWIGRQIAKSKQGNFDTGLIDYGPSSTIVGWSSFTRKDLRYGQSGNNGKTMRVVVDFQGTSNSTSVTFTLPFPTIASVNQFVGPIRIQDNGGSFVFGLFVVNTASSTVTIHSTPGGGGWTASGTKVVQGEFWIELA